MTPFIYFEISWSLTSQGLLLFDAARGSPSAGRNKHSGQNAKVTLPKASDEDSSGLSGPPSDVEVS